MTEPRRRPERPIAMRRTLGTLVALMTLVITAACGSTSSSSVATDPSRGPASDPAGNPTWPPGPIPDAHVLPLISMTAAGGKATPVATPLDTEAQVARFTAQFRMPAIRHRIRAAVAGSSTSGDHALVGQVVAVGCDRPPGVDVVANADGRVELVPHEVASPLQECLAAVTTVAIAELPSS